MGNMATAFMGVGMAAQIGGGIMGMVGANKTANNSITQYKYQAFSSRVNSMVDQSNAAIAKMNSSIQLMNASMSDTNSQIAIMGGYQELAKGQDQVAKLTMQVGQLEASQKASMAAHGIDITQGSAAEVLKGTELMKRVDINTIEANAARAAFGYTVTSMNYKAKALTDRMNALGYDMASTSDMMKSVIDETQANMYDNAATSVSPGMAVTGSLLSTIGGVSNSWAMGKAAGAWG